MSGAAAALERWAHARWAAPALFALALLAYAVAALGWPLQRGRDLWDYLVYSLSLFDAETPFRLVMLMRTPLTAAAVGLPLEVGGALALEVVMALAFATTIVVWAGVARRHSGLAAWLAAALLLANPVVALAFHEASSDFVAATLFALYGLAVVRAWSAPGIGRFALVGGLVAALVLARPAYQALLLGAVLPLLATGPTRQRLLRTGAFAACALVPLAVWAVHNGVRYGDTTVSRAGKYNIPFYTAFRAGEIDAVNGPESAGLARLVEREILTLPAYARLGVDVDTYFQTRSNLEAVRLAGLVDRVDGIGSDYARLVRVAQEVPDEDGLRIGAVSVRRSLDAAWALASETATRESRLRSVRRDPPSSTVEVAGRPVPNPIVIGIPEDAEEYGFLACAGSEIERCILARPEERYHDLALARRYAEITAQVRDWDAELGTRAPQAFVARALDGVVRRLPPPWVWAAIALVALGVRRPRGWPALLWLVLAGGGMLVVHGIGVGADLYYALPVLPAWIVAAAAALLGRRDAPAAAVDDPGPAAPAVDGVVAG